MSERNFQIISEEPRLANLLRARKRVILPDDLYEWTVDYIEDVGSLMRSRGYKVGFVASAAGYAVLAVIAKNFPMTTELGIISEALGLRR